MNEAEEKEKLELAVDWFAHQMKERLVEKMKEGFTGWDDPGLDLSEPMSPHLDAAAAGGENEVDLANFLMFKAWRRLMCG